MCVYMYIHAHVSFSIYKSIHLAFPVIVGSGLLDVRGDVVGELGHRFPSARRKQQASWETDNLSNASGISLTVYEHTNGSRSAPLSLRR